MQHTFGKRPKCTKTETFSDYHQVQRFQFLIYLNLDRFLMSVEGDTHLS
jgi:hypothetical protein